MIRTFLSASVPLPERHPKFVRSADVIAIREAVKGLVEEVAPIGQIVFGGHPAITPLIAKLINGMGNRVKGHITIYQSSYFADRYPEENSEFLKIKIVPKVNDSEVESIEAMRREMIRSQDFDAGIFIGGMEGVLSEFELFRSNHPNALIWPIASTGAAAKEIFETLGNPEPDLLMRELTYSTLFRKLLKSIPRYN